MLHSIIVRRNAARTNAGTRDTIIVIANVGKTDVSISQDIEAVNVYNEGVCMAHYDYGTDRPRRFVCLKPGQAMVKEDISVSNEQWQIMAKGDSKVVVRFHNKDGGIECESLLYEEP